MALEIICIKILFSKKSYFTIMDLNKAGLFNKLPSEQLINL